LIKSENKTFLILNNNVAQCIYEPRTNDQSRIASYRWIFSGLSRMRQSEPIINIKRFGKRGNTVVERKDRTCFEGSTHLLLVLPRRKQRHDQRRSFYEMYRLETIRRYSRCFCWKCTHPSFSRAGHTDNETPLTCRL